MNVSLFQTFDFNEAAVRVVMREAQPWFVAADVCRVLDLTNPTEALRGLDDDEKATLSNPEARPGQPGAKVMNVISESGLYALIFKSRKAEAKVFRKWVTAEVLPALRQAGVYAVPASASESPSLASAPEMMSVPAFVRLRCAGWSLERQMELGLLARRYARSVGLMFQVLVEPGLGRVLGYPRALLETVRGSYAQEACLPDPEAADMRRLLEAVLLSHGAGAMLSGEQLRAQAKALGLFPDVLRRGASAASERSAFGKLCLRHQGFVFPGGLVLQVRGAPGTRRFEVRLHPAEAVTRAGAGVMALSA